MNLFTQISQLKVQGINLIFFIGSSSVAIYMNVRNKNIKLKLVKKIFFYGIIGAILGAVLSNKIDNNDSLKKYFGIFLIGIAITGTYTFISKYIKNKKRQK